MWQSASAHVVHCSPHPRRSPGAGAANVAAAWIDATALCRRFGISRSKLERDLRSGSVPQPVRRGRVRRWSVAEVETYEGRLLADRLDVRTS